MIVIGSSMCTNDKIKDQVTAEAEKNKAHVHLEFCFELYQEQMRRGRYFLHEHPAHSAFWPERTISDMSPVLAWILGWHRQSRAEAHKVLYEFCRARQGVA